MSNESKLYTVTITETLRKTVTVDATSLCEAEEKVTEEYYDELHILTADDFSDVDFTAH